MSTIIIAIAAAGRLKNKKKQLLTNDFSDIYFDQFDRRRDELKFLRLF